MSSERDHLRTTLQALIDQEQELTATARTRLGSFVDLGSQGIALLNTFVKSIGEEHFLAAALQLAMQKAATLAFLSYIRRHLAQAEFNSRQTIEFCPLCAYMLAHPEYDVTHGPQEDSPRFLPPQATSSKAYKWLREELPDLSLQLKEIKNQINETAAHASLYLTHLSFDWKRNEEGEYRGSFFDTMAPDISRLYLASFSRLILIIVEVIRRTAVKYGGFSIQEGIESELIRFEKAIETHRGALAARVGAGGL